MTEMHSGRCSHCGATLGAAARRFCEHCGTAVTSNAPPPVPGSMPPPIAPPPPSAIPPSADAAPPPPPKPRVVHIPEIELPPPPRNDAPETGQFSDSPGAALKTFLIASSVFLIPCCGIGLVLLFLLMFLGARSPKT